MIYRNRFSDIGNHCVFNVIVVDEISRPSLKATLFIFLNVLKSATFFVFEAVLSFLYSDDSIASLPVTEALSIEHIIASCNHSICTFLSYSYFDGANDIFGSAGGAEFSIISRFLPLNALSRTQLPRRLNRPFLYRTYHKPF